MGKEKAEHMAYRFSLKNVSNIYQNEKLKTDDQTIGSIPGTG